MKSFCTSCGAELGVDTRFCTRCGTENPVPAAAAKKKDRRWLWWVLALILVFILGFLLGKMLAPKCPQCPAVGAGSGGGGGGRGGGGGGGGGGSGGAGGGGGGGDGAANGAGSGGGGGGGGGPGGGGGGGGPEAKNQDLKGGNPLDQKPEDGEPPGPGNGKKQPTGPDDPQPPGTLSDADVAAGDLTKLTAGKPLTLGDDDDKPGDGSPPMKSFTAHDFTYDKTGLPHYPDAVTGVVSSITYDVPNRTDTYRTGAGIVTTSSFDTVVAWYQKNLPGGWQSSTVGDFGRLGAQAKQLSPENIMKMLTSAQSGASSSLTPMPATAAEERIQISIFKPPAGSTPDHQIMIVQKGNHPVEALLQAQIKP